MAKGKRTLEVDLEKELERFEAASALELPPTPTSEVSVSDVLRMKRDWVSQRQYAIDELLQQQKIIAAQLAELEYNVESDSVPAWVSSPARAKRKGVKKAVTKKAVAKETKSTGMKFCPICKIETNHDGRAHRYQKKKKAFTTEEIEALKK